mgnify:FL=1
MKIRQDYKNRIQEQRRENLLADLYSILAWACVLGVLARFWMPS